MNGGLGLTFGQLDLSIFYSKLISAPRTVGPSESTLLQTVAFPKTDAYPNGVVPVVVGAGTYTSNFDVFGATVRYRFDFGAPATPTRPEPAPPATPEPAPAATTPTES